MLQTLAWVASRRCHINHSLLTASLKQLSSTARRSLPSPVGPDIRSSSSACCFSSFYLHHLTVGSRTTRNMTTTVAHHNRISPAGGGGDTKKSTTSLGGCETYYLDGCQGKMLYARCWRPSGQIQPRGLVFMCHGYAEHLAWYEPLSTSLADKGLLVFGHDHVGHGRSEGVRGMVSDAGEYVKDVLTHVNRLTNQHPHLPLYIVGHSMGGMISISAVLSDSRFRGAVLMGPLILPDPKEATPFKIAAAKLVARLFPTFPVGRLNLDLVTRDEEMLSRLAKDELGYQGAIRAQWACSNLELMLQNKALLAEFSVPFLILHGEKDGLCTLQGSQILYDEAPVEDKRLKVFPDARHNLYIEIPSVRQEAIQDTIDWILQRLPPQK